MTYPEPMNIFEALRKDHDIQRKLVDQLIETKGNSPDRMELFSDLRMELKAHAMAEERHFYVPLMKSDLTQEKARHSIAEHQDLDKLIETLEDTDFSSPAWLGHANELRKKLLHHLDEEEHEVFQMAGKVLKEKQKTSLAHDYTAMLESEM